MITFDYDSFVKYYLPSVNNNQIFHLFLIDIRNYSPEVDIIRKAELVITLRTVNNSDKQKMAWNICFLYILSWNIYIPRTKQKLGEC